MQADGLGIPDFVFSTTASSFTNRFRDQIFPFDRECCPRFLDEVNQVSRENEAVRYRYEKRCHVEC